VAYFKAASAIISPFNDIKCVMSSSASDSCGSMDAFAVAVISSVIACTSRGHLVSAVSRAMLPSSDVHTGRTLDSGNVRAGISNSCANADLNGKLNRMVICLAVLKTVVKTCKTWLCFKLIQRSPRYMLVRRFVRHRHGQEASAALRPLMPKSGNSPRYPPSTHKVEWVVSISARHRLD
jgi:hypothetical protein